MQIKTKKETQAKLKKQDFSILWVPKQVAVMVLGFHPSILSFVHTFVCFHVSVLSFSFITLSDWVFYLQHLVFWVHSSHGLNFCLFILLALTTLLSMCLSVRPPPLCSIQYFLFYFVLLLSSCHLVFVSAAFRYPGVSHIPDYIVRI